MEKRNLRKERIGVVSSNKGDKTITVTIRWKEKHPIYGKFVNKSKKYHAHDENNECSVGDTVRLMETRPLSKTKRWRLVEIIEKALLDIHTRLTVDVLEQSQPLAEVHVWIVVQKLAPLFVPVVRDCSGAAVYLQHRV